MLVDFLAQSGCFRCSYRIYVRLRSRLWLRHSKNITFWMFFWWWTWIETEHGHGLCPPRCHFMIYTCFNVFISTVTRSTLHSWTQVHTLPCMITKLGVLSLYRTVFVYTLQCEGVYKCLLHDIKHQTPNTREKETSHDLSGLTDSHLTVNPLTETLL